MTTTRTAGLVAAILTTPALSACSSGSPTVADQIKAECGADVGSTSYTPEQVQCGVAVANRYEGR